MGQYYYPTFFRQKGNRVYKTQFYAHNYDNGLKLTEHSYVGNNFVETVLTQLFNKPQNVYWCGDYFDEFDFHSADEYNKMREAWKKYHVKLNNDGSYVSNYPRPKETRDFSIDKFIVNHTKKCFIDMKKYCEIAPTATKDYDWHFHPLPLLTAVGNGRGGGDYYGLNEEDVGVWAGDLIEVKANRHVIPEDYTDVTKDIGFQENY